MQLQSLKVSDCYESETNPRGKDFAGKSFDELVKSIEEKGVLVPVLARPHPSKKGWEIVAGNRRLRAAKQVGLTEIPAQIEMDMDDVHAQEAQIIENLQREDVHPLEEGEAYRKLIEDRGMAVKDVAVRVGKPEDYVRQRLFLTNLCDKARKLYRAGEMADSVAYLVARLSPSNQEAMVAKARWALTNGASDTKRYITEHFSEPLKNQPWLKDQNRMADVVGPCKECPPNRAALFGNVKTGACTDLRCWGRKMKAYLAYRLKENPDLVLVSTQYGKPETANVLGRGDYELVKKTACESAKQAMIAEGDGLGWLLWICADKKCDEHGGGQKSDYRPDEKERAKRKQEREKQNARRTKFDEDVAAALAKVKWPLSEKHLDALFDLMLDDKSTQAFMPIVKRHGLKADVKKHNGYTQRDYETPLRKMAEADGKEGRLRLIFELLLPSWYVYGDEKEQRKLIAKL